MNTRQAWDGGKRTPKGKPLNAIRQTVKGFKDYQEWLPVLESLEQDFRSWQKQGKGRPTT